MNHLEIEFKYNAKDISLEDFKAFCIKRKPTTELVVSGSDCFYANPSSKNSFYRLREGNGVKQLTFKRKTTENNSYVRTEHNIDLASYVTEEQVRALCIDMGYEYNTCIYKTSVVYTYPWYILAFYICYDLNMNEIGRFIEIEMSEIHPWTSEKEAWAELLTLERICKPLGIKSKDRINESLFEMFKKEAT